jgi:hypothetical protein
MDATKDVGTAEGCGVQRNRGHTPAAKSQRGRNKQRTRGRKRRITEGGKDRRTLQLKQAAKKLGGCRKAKTQRKTRVRRERRRRKEVKKHILRRKARARDKAEAKAEAEQEQEHGYVATVQRAHRASEEDESATATEEGEPDWEVDYGGD